jgi:hypothetical protein
MATLDNKPQGRLEKDRKAYGYLASLPIVLTVVHLVSYIVFQSLLSLDSNGVYSQGWALCSVFLSSAFCSQLCSLSGKKDLVTSLAAIVSIVFGLAFLFLSSQAVKGKFRSLWISLGLYGLDTLFLVPIIFLSAKKITPLVLTNWELGVNLGIHLLFLAGLIAGVAIAKRLQANDPKANSEVR